MHPPDVERELLDEMRKLTDDNGHRQNNDDCDQSNRKSNDGKRGHGPVYAEPLDPIGEGVEQIRKHHTRDKGQ
jgi:hypothetical protein